MKFFSGAVHVVEFRKENPEWFMLLITLWTESVNNEKLAAELLGIDKEMKLGIIEVINRLELQLDEDGKGKSGDAHSGRY